MGAKYLTLDSAAEFFDFAPDQLMAWLEGGALPEGTYFIFQEELRFCIPALEEYFRECSAKLGRNTRDIAQADRVVRRRACDVIKSMHWMICRQDFYLRLLQKWLGSGWDFNETVLKDFSEHVKGVVQHYLDTGDLNECRERLLAYSEKYERVDRKVSRLFRSCDSLRDDYPFPPDKSVDLILDAMQSDDRGGKLPEFLFYNCSPTFPRPSD